MADNAHIRDFLAYYCTHPNEPQYAVLLTGLWGSGKTWFIKDFVEHHLLKPERVLYLSLYGMQSLEDVESELFRLLHPLLGSKPARLLGRFARGILKTSLNFDIDGDGKSDGNISGGVPAEKLLERISLKKDQILILDDIERCSIPVADLLGYTNQFVEHGGIKAILVANEDELLSQESSVNARYARIKEKLIGRTFEVIPEVQSALEHFSTELPSNRAREVVQANFSLISQVYDCSTYKNLRLIRHALWDFDRLLKAVDPTALRSDSLLADLLALFLTYSLEVGSGSIPPSKISKLQNNWARFLKQSKDESDPDQAIYDIQKKYSGLNLYESLVEDAVWQTIFSKGSIPQAELNATLLKSKYFQNENQPNWVKLWYGMNLSDSAFAVVLSLVEAEWDSRAYRNLGEVIHVTGLLVRFAKNNILGRSVEEVIESGKSYINILIESGEIPIIKPNLRVSPFDHDSYAGLGYASLEEDQFKEFLVYTNERRQYAQEASLPAQASELLALVETDPNLFYRRVILNNDSENIYYKTPILHLIRPAEFVEKLLAITPEERRTVAYALKERYSVHQFNGELVSELQWLREIATILRNEVAARTGKISSLSLGWILDPYIIDAITRLEEASAPAT